MKHSLALVVATAALLTTPARAQTPPPAISVTGEATVSVAPDQAQIDGGVATDAKTAREASDANNAAMGKVLLALKGAGIDEKDEPLSISEEGSATPVFRSKVAGGMAASAAPVAQGEETLSVTVNVSWAIKPKE